MESNPRVRTAFDFREMAGGDRREDMATGNALKESLEAMEAGHYC